MASQRSWKTTNTHWRYTSCITILPESIRHCALPRPCRQAFRIMFGVWRKLRGFCIENVPPPAIDFSPLGADNCIGMALDKELAFFEKVKADLLKNHAGKFALIKGDEFIGAFDSPDNAFAEGVKRFGKDIFLIK